MAKDRFWWTPWLILGLLLVSAPALAATKDVASATPSFYGDVLPILQNNCQACHRQQGSNMGGLIAPMSFTSYEDTRPWARSIAKSVKSHYMPPWHASEQHHGVFANERTLTIEEIDTLVAWAKGGAPAGDVAEAPAPIDWPETGWAIGEPDLIIDMPEEYVVGDEIEDVYANFTTRLPLTEDRWVKAIEFRPGSEVVHHIIGYAINPDDGFGAGERGMIGGIAPGNDPDEFPEGYGYKLEAGSMFVFAMHYHKEKGAGTATPDRSQVAFKFYPEGETPNQIHVESIGNGKFEIPPRAENWQVGAARTFDRPITVQYLMPHMHLRGKACRYTAVLPDGTSEVLLDVPEYDFNWQTSYKYKEPRAFPAGTRLELQLWYTNSDDRAAEAGFNADRPVRFGGPTTDEMDLGFFAFSYSDPEPEETETETGP